MKRYGICRLMKVSELRRITKKGDIRLCLKEFH